MTEEHVPDLRLSASAEAFLSDSDILTWIPLFSILFAPEIDGELKRRHASDMILFSCEGLYVAYRLLASGDIYIGFVHYESVID